MLAGGKGPVIEDDFILDGYLVGFKGGKGNWFYTPEEPTDCEDTLVKECVDESSRNFPTKDEARAFGRGYENGVN